MNCHNVISHAVCFVLMMSPVAAAQSGAGSIAGLVRDTTAGVLPGVTVEATSPALIEKVRTAISDGAGLYKIIELPPGIYVVTFALPGFATVRREGIALTTGFTATVNVEMGVGDVTETITVSGQSPIVDVQNVRTQAVMTREVIDTIPTARGYQNLGVLVPGVTVSAIAGPSQDVGGAAGISYPQLAIHGGRLADQMLQVNGMSVAILDNESVSTMTFSDGNLEEIVMDVASQSAETETGGVRINMIPKKGGNRFSGGVFVNFTTSGLQSDNFSEELRVQGLRAPNRMKRALTLTPTLGGPILKDRLWFYGSYGTMINDTYVAGMFVNTTPAAWTPKFDQSQQAVNDETTHDQNIHFTLQASQKNKLTFYYDYNYSYIYHNFVSATRSPEASFQNRRPNHLTQGTWQLPLTNRLLFEAGGSYLTQGVNRSPQENSTESGILESNGNLIYRGPTSFPIYKLHTNNANVRGSVAYVTGSHALKVGFTSMFSQETQRGLTDQSRGSVTYTVLNGVPTTANYYSWPTITKFRNYPRTAIFAQDQWTVRRMTINAGLRYDYLKSYYPDLTQPGGEYFPVPRNLNGLVVVRWHDLNPRLGLTYDLLGTGKTALKVSVNRYVQQQGSDQGGSPAHAVTPALNNQLNARKWTDDGDFVVQGDPTNPAPNLELGPTTNLLWGQMVPTTRHAPEYAFGYGVRPANWETSTGIQHGLSPNVALAAGYFRRAFVNRRVTDNFLVAPSDYDPYCVTSPVDARLPGGGGQQICDLYDLSPTKVGQLDRVLSSTTNYADSYQHWNGFDLTVNARVPRGFLQGGLSSGKTTTDDCNFVTKLDNPSKLYCHVETPFLTQHKFMGSYTLPWAIQLSGSYQSVPGPEIIADAIFTNAQVRSSLGRNLSSAATATVNLVSPATMYGERMHQLDLRVAKTFTVGRTRFQGMVDLYNALNANSILTVNNTYGATGTSWQVPTFVLTARIVKFGMQMTF